MKEREEGGSGGEKRSGWRWRTGIRPFLEDSEKYVKLLSVPMLPSKSGVEGTITL